MFFLQKIVSYLFITIDALIGLKFRKKNMSFNI